MCFRPNSADSAEFGIKKIDLFSGFLIQIKENLKYRIFGGNSAELKKIKKIFFHIGRILSNSTEFPPNFIKILFLYVFYQKNKEIKQLNDLLLLFYILTFDSIKKQIILSLDSIKIT